MDILLDNSESRRPWQRSLIALFVLFTVYLIAYRDTAIGMVDIWWRSETFTHAFLVPPISVWLIWRIRRDLSRYMPAPALTYIFLLLGIGVVWLLGVVANVAVVSQFAFVSMFVVTVPIVLGTTISRKLTFPLLFLYFAVPFGEFALPQLMEWTASVTVWGLRLSGIPVFREGLHFVIPSGQWSVVEACSGVRYLIASLTVGALFAYLTYRSFKRRILFVLVAALVPLVANWFRAYLIVLLGHVSGNRLAAGVDHLIYGWVFFGLVIVIMFAIGVRWQEDGEMQPNKLKSSEIADSFKGHSSSFFFWGVLLALLTGMAPKIVDEYLERSKPVSVISNAIWLNILGWNECTDALPQWEPAYNGYIVKQHACYENNLKRVGVFIAYYRDQNSARKMVTSTNRLVSYDDPRWREVGSGVVSLALGRQGGESIRLSSAMIRSVDGKSISALRWYWVDGRLTSSDALAKIYTVMSRLKGRGDDSAVVIIYGEQSPTVNEDLQAFLRLNLSNITNALDAVRGY